MSSEICKNNFQKLLDKLLFVCYTYKIGIQTNELRAAILRKGLTQSKVAKAIGISDKTFSDRMKKKVFGSDEIEKMIDLLEIENPMFVFFNR